MYQDRHIKRSGHAGRRLAALLISAALIAAIAVGGTVAWLSAKTSPTVNTFTPSHVSCSVEESFDGKTKSSVNVLNTGDTDAYIRVKLVSYRVNEQGQHIGGTADIPEFTPGENWVKNGGYYYYTLPVKPNDKPAADLIESITLTDSYNDPDGGRQVIEVMAEAIQSGPEAAVKAAWGADFSIGADGSLIVPGN